LKGFAEDLLEAIVLQALLILATGHLLPHSVQICGKSEQSGVSKVPVLYANNHDFGNNHEFGMGEGSLVV
jgi:hypothetical protein